MESAAAPARCRRSRLALGAAVILQAAALAPYTRYGERIVRTLVIFNAVHLLSSVQFAGLDPNPVIRVVCSDLIGAAALFSAAFIVWRPSRKEFARLSRIIAIAYSATATTLLLQGW